VEDWEDEAFEDEALEEEELARVQQEMERLHQKKASQGGRQQLSMSKSKDSILTEKEQDSRSSSTPLRSFTNRSRGKSLRLRCHITKTTSTHHLYLRHISKYDNLNTHRQQCMKSIHSLCHNMAPPTQKAHWQITYN
jgi:hypothetical protein